MKKVYKEKILPLIYLPINLIIRLIHGISFITFFFINSIFSLIYYIAFPLIKFFVSIIYFKKAVVKLLDLLLLSELIVYFFITYFKIQINFLHFLLYSPALFLFIYFLVEMNFSEKKDKFYKRYKNSLKLKNAPLNYLDYFYLFIISLILAYFIFHGLFSKPISESGIITLLWINLLIVTIGVAFNLLSQFISLLTTDLIKKSGISEEFNPLKPVSKPLRIESDKPIIHQYDDVLSRVEFIKDLADQISDIPINFDSFIFGLYGSWGEGKTSIINLLQNNLEENNIIVNFDPWHFKDQEVITRSFYSELEAAINKEYIFPNFHKTMEKYLRMISLNIRHYGVTVNPLAKSDSIEETKKRIESYIDFIPKKIIIFIDNIDRLQKNEILLIFQLVRLNSNFKNTVYLLSFDRKAVIEQINDNDAFIDKIIQKPVLVPPIEENKIREILLEKFSNFPGKENLSILNNYIEYGLREDYHLIWSSIGRNFKTIRHLKIYLNSLYSTLPPIEGRINFKDLFIVEAIRVFFPEILNIIYRYPAFFLPIAWDSQPGRKSNETHRNDVSLDVVAVLGKYTKDAQTLRDIFYGLFPFMPFNKINQLGMARTGPEILPQGPPNFKYYNENKSINSLEFFRNYFTLVK